MLSTDQTAPVFWKACVRSEAHSGGSMGWEGNRQRLLHGADGTNLYSGDGIPNDTHSRYEYEKKGIKVIRLGKKTT